MERNPLHLWNAWKTRRDAGAFEALVLPELGRAVAWARAAGCPPEEAEDAVQESLMRLARERGEAPERVGVRGWFFGIVRDRAHARRRSLWRRRRRESLAALPEAAPEAVPGWELREEVERALAGLSEADREAVRLRFLLDLDYREVAHVLGITEGACRVRVHRSLQRLRAALGAGAGAALGAAFFPVPARAAAWVSSSVAAAPAPAAAATLGGIIAMTAAQKTAAAAATGLLLCALGVGFGVVIAPALRPEPAAPPAASGGSASSAKLRSGSTPPGARSGENRGSAAAGGASPAPAPAGGGPLTGEEVRRIVAEEMNRRLGAPEPEERAPEPVNPAHNAEPSVREAVRESVMGLRRTVLTNGMKYAFTKALERPDPAVLEQFPDERVWPNNLLGWIEQDPARYVVLEPDGKGYDPTRKGAWVFTGVLDRPLATDSQATLVFDAGIGSNGVVTAQNYTTLLCKGEMSGALHLDSYATAVIEGSLSGSVTTSSYATVLVRGALSGSFLSKSYVNIRILGGFTGKMDLHDGASLYFGGFTPQAALDAITFRGRGKVTLESSDLAPGTYERTPKVEVIVLEPR